MASQDAMRIDYLGMNDKSEIMMDLGGEFYTSVDEVPGLANTVHQAVGLFEPFKERLNNMEDDGHRERFCANHKEDDKDKANEKHEKARWGIGLLNELR